MNKNVLVIENEDSSVKELLSKTAEDLRKKYNKQRRINNKLLNKKTPFQKALSIFLDVVCVLSLILGFVICFSTFNATINGYMPNFAGYTNLIVTSPSMVDSGFNVGDIVIVHSVNPRTLNVNDKIAFYVYPPSSASFNEYYAENISSQINKTKYSLTFKQLFGFQTEEIKNARDNNCKFVFHHIREIYRDENGELWFKTYGSSNSRDDSWWINEKYVVGIQDEGTVAKCAIGLVEFANKPYRIMLFLIPIAFLVISLILSIIKNIQIVKLELDCVEEKRKITDEICVKNNVGYQMSLKTKLKILAQSTNDNREEYIKLLWKGGRAPDNIKKYYLRKKLLISTNKELLELNRECEKMFKENKDPQKIASHYLTEKKKIEAKTEKMRERIKLVAKQKNK